MSFTCPYAVRMKILNNGLACKKAMKEGVDYNIQENAYTVFCCCQRYCPTERRTINSDGAKKCYEYHSRE